MSMAFDSPKSPGRLSTNPKDAIGNVKLPLHLWPPSATAMGCLGLLEGDCKYGVNNYRSGDGVVASIYVAAAMRHLSAWYEGEEVSADSGVPHLANALACLAILVDSQAHEKLVDDRAYTPTDGYRRLVEKLTPTVGRLRQLFKDRHPKRWTAADNPEKAVDGNT